MGRWIWRRRSREAAVLSTGEIDGYSRPRKPINLPKGACAVGGDSGILVTVARDTDDPARNGKEPVGHDVVGFQDVEVCESLSCDEETAKCRVARQIAREREGLGPFALHRQRKAAEVLLAALLGRVHDELNGAISVGVDLVELPYRRRRPSVAQQRTENEPRDARDDLLREMD